MKKIVCITAILLIVLCSCSSNTSSNLADTPTYCPSATPHKSISPETTVDIPDDLTDNQKQILEKCLFTLNPGDCEYEITKYEDNADIGTIINLDVKTDKTVLYVLLYEQQEECYIEDKESKHFYYVPDNYLKEMYDIYDYNTDKLIQKASGKDANELFEEQQEKNSKEFDDKMDELKKKYGIDF